MKISYKLLCASILGISNLQSSLAAEQWSKPTYTFDWSKDYTVPQQAPSQPTPQITQRPVPQQQNTTDTPFASLCKIGNRVEVKSAGQWYEATILKADAYYQTCEVTYKGFPKHWDEEVNINRIRPYTGKVTPPPKKTTSTNHQYPQQTPSVGAPICSTVPRSDGMGNTSYCY